MTSPYESEKRQQSNEAYNMKARDQIKQTALVGALTTAILSQASFAHTRLEVPTLPEATRAFNNVVIGHGCGTNPVIGTSVVFPDGVTSTITVDGQPHAGPLTDFVSNWGPSISVVQSEALFSLGGVKRSPEGKIVGFWAGGGGGLSTDMIGPVPFRVNAVTIEPGSCAVSVRFEVSIVDVCEITPIGDLRADGVAGLWTPHDLGTPYDRAESGGPASLTITRDLTTNPLPFDCGDGVAVEVRSSAEQINRDMPVYIDGTQIWPQ
jgi:hypothetical protein